MQEHWYWHRAADTRSKRIAQLGIGFYENFLIKTHNWEWWCELYELRKIWYALTDTSSRPALDSKRWLPRCHSSPKLPCRISKVVAGVSCGEKEWCRGVHVIRGCFASECTCNRRMRMISTHFPQESPGWCPNQPPVKHTHDTPGDRWKGWGISCWACHPLESYCSRKSHVSAHFHPWMRTSCIQRATDWVEY